MANNIDIHEIFPSDIISDSMHKINYNFLQIAEHEDITEYKLAQISKDFNTELENIKNVINYRELGIFKSINQLSDRITELPSLDKLQSAIDIAITNATGDLDDFIKLTAKDEITSALGGYATQKYVRDQDALISSSFSKYLANAQAKYASLSHTVGNSEFMRDKDTNCFIWLDGQHGGGVSEYNSIQGYYNGSDITEFEKTYIDKDSEYTDKLQDPDVVQRLIEVCIDHFRTVATELATITEEIGDGFSRTTLLNWINDPEHGDITAAIFLEANKDGSSIKLNANHLNLTGDDVVVDTNNLKVNVNGDGKVSVTGEIQATSLKIGVGNKTYDLTNSDSAKLFVRAFETPNTDGGGEGGSSDYEPYDDSWLTGAFSEISAGGGVLLAGNLLVGSSEGNVTAGMMGASTSGNDLRFFAGSSFANRTNAPFRVYEDGTIVAKNISELNSPSDSTYIDSNGILHANGAIISGDITANAVETSGNGMNTRLGNGILKIYNGSTDNERNLRAAFGLESDGYVVLKFYDNNGEEMYDLGPNGITRLGEKVDLPEIDQYETRKMSSKPQVNDNFQYSTLTTKQMVYLYKDGRKITSVGQNQVIQYWDPISKSYRNEHSIFNEKWLKTANPTSESDLFTTSLSTTQYYVAAPWQWDQGSDITANVTKAGLFILDKNTGTTLGYIKIYSEDSPSSGTITEVYPSDL